MHNTMLSLLTAVAISPPGGFANATAAGPADAGGPALALRRADTSGYGQFGCLQRTQNKLYALGATGVGSNGNVAWGDMGVTSVLVGCRGSEAIISTGGPRASEIADEMRTAY